jgi:hypothetical protein
MRVFKKLLLVLMAFVATVLVIGWFLPETSTLEVSTEVNQGLAETRAEFGDSGMWTMMKRYRIGDSSMRDGQLGFFIPTADSLQVYRGMLVTKVPAELRSTEEFRFDTSASGSKITWTSKSTLTYPLGRYWGLFMPDSRRNTMKNQLDSMRVFMESALNEPPQPVDFSATTQPD